MGFVLFCFSFFLFFLFSLFTYNCIIHTRLYSPRTVKLYSNVIRFFFYFTIEGNRTFSCCRVCDLFLIMVSLKGIHSVLSEFTTSIQSLFSTHGNSISVYTIRKYTYFDILQHIWALYRIEIMHNISNRSNRIKGYFCNYITFYRSIHM